MPRPCVNTLDSYEDLPLDSPERRMIQNRNAQRVYRAKKRNRQSSMEVTSKGPAKPPARGDVQPRVVPAPNANSSTSSDAGIAGIALGIPTPAPSLMVDQGSWRSDGDMVTAPSHLEDLDVGGGSLWANPAIELGQTLDLYQIPASTREEFGSPSLLASDLDLNSPPPDFLEQPMSMSLGNSMPSASAVAGPADPVGKDRDHGGHRSPPPGRRVTESAQRPGMPHQHSRSANSIDTLSSLACRPRDISCTRPRRPPFFAPDDELALDGPSFEDGPCAWRHAIHTAAQSGQIRVIQLLLQSGCDASARDGVRSTPLHIAAAEGHYEVVKLLLDRGADINAADRRGWTSVHLAAKNGHENCVRLLLHRGAELWVNPQD